MEKSEAVVSECELECATKAVVEKCGCHDSYMKPHWNGTGFCCVELLCVLNMCIEKVLVWKTSFLFCLTGFSEECSVNASFLCAAQALGEKKSSRDKTSSESTCTWLQKILCAKRTIFLFRPDN